MRKQFFDYLFEQMAVNKDIVLVTADLGFGLLDKIRDTYPDRFFNVGASEQLMLGVGVGLSLEGKIPVLYTITPFLLFRAAEWIRNYLVHEDIFCLLVGSGVDKDYAHDGWTHDASDAYLICTALGLPCNILCSESLLDAVFQETIRRDRPAFIGLER